MPKKISKTNSEIQEITVVGAMQNNLKNLDVSIPRRQMIVFTGPSGSGKSSLAFDTIYAEGQRRYIESLSPYARQFVKQMPKPKVTHVEGLSPAIAIEQKAHAGNPRSTVGTMTEVYDYLRILYARVGIAHDPETGEEIKAISKDLVVERVLTLPDEEKLHILAPLEIKKNEQFSDVMARFKREGFLRIRLNETIYELDAIDQIPYNRKAKQALFLVIDRLKVSPAARNRLFEAVENAAKISDNQVVILREEGEELYYNLSFSVESTGKSYQEITPQTFAFNTPEGMCPECLGLGYQFGANLIQKLEILEMTLVELLQYLWSGSTDGFANEMLAVFLAEEDIDPLTALKDLNSKQLQMLLNGSKEEKLYTLRSGIRFRWIGVNHSLTRAARNARYQIREEMSRILEQSKCLSCHGARVNPLARHVTIDNIPIHVLCEMPAEESLKFVAGLQFKPQDIKLLDEVKSHIVNRLQFMCQVGLQYLSLNRSAPSLSGGESQRIRLARQLGSGLTGVLYVLDEPTIGLHPRDNDRLNDALKQLKELGNTLLLVEHDPLTLKAADYLLDFGPHSGELGGRIMAQGTYDQICANPQSLTGQYLTGALKIDIPKKRRKSTKGDLQIKQAKLHNLKNITVKFPIGVISCLTGVSGSGKSTLLQDIIFPAALKAISQKIDQMEEKGAKLIGFEHFDKVISIDQNPLGQTNRADVGTYVEAFDQLRALFASLPAAKIKGLQGKHFSYNHRAGMCTKCWGLGYRKIQMQFLPPVKVTCEDCHGLRLNPISLQVEYQGKNLGQYLNSTIDEARGIFQNYPKLVRILDTLIAVGLGYLKIGQEIASLSGGEAQRIKLSRELAKRSTGRTLYLMDEPTTGLHSDDISKLLKVLHQLADKGNTLLIIEHNLEIIKNADYLVELGPEAGEKGGKVIATGTPEKLAQVKDSPTAPYLRKVLT